MWGLHLQETKQVGIFKIISSQTIQDGLIRLTFCVKEFALNFIQEEEKTLSEISQIFKTNKNDLLNNCKNLESNFRKNLKIIDTQKNTLKNIILKRILISKEISYESNEELDLNFLIEIFQEVLKEKKDFELLTKKFIISTKEVKENCNKKINKESFSIYIK